MILHLWLSAVTQVHLLKLKLMQQVAILAFRENVENKIRVPQYSCTLAFSHKKNIMSIILYLFIFSPIFYTPMTPNCYNNIYLKQLSINNIQLKTDLNYNNFNKHAREYLKFQSYLRAHNINDTGSLQMSVNSETWVRLCLACFKIVGRWCDQKDFSYFIFGFSICNFIN